jgi:hypothetical protein
MLCEKPGEVMTGATAFGFHEGSRSEILADYLFSAWGTVTPVRRQDDYGLDLYCTLTDQVGRRARVREYYSVQVKSSSNAFWAFDDTASVKWLVEQPLPLFLCTVNKKEGIVRVYHTFVRFQIWASGAQPDRLELSPGEGTDGKYDACANLPNCCLSAPILQVDLADLSDEVRMEKLRSVFDYWVKLDRGNCEFVRSGLFRFRRPHSYETNEIPSTADTQLDLLHYDDEHLNHGLLRLAESIDCIGGQLAFRGKHAFGLEAALLLDRIQKDFPDAIKGNNFLLGRVPGWLGTVVVRRLHEALGETDSYYFAGLDAVRKALADNPLVQKYLKE